MASSSSSESLRQQLQQRLGLTLRPSGRPHLSDLVAHGNPSTSALQSAQPLAHIEEQAGLWQVRYRDSALLGLGCLGQRGRAGHLARLSQSLGAQCPGRILPDLRPLWLSLESLQYCLQPSVYQRALRRLDAYYQREPLAGSLQAPQGFPQLQQLAQIAGALEGFAPSGANLPR